MARLIHLSDLHFGAHDQRLVEEVEAELNALKPDLVVISGDFTQRARTEQFREACHFLEKLRDSGHEVLGVPGNHDVPLYDVLRRFLTPLARYRRFIDESLCPFVELPGVAVLGMLIGCVAYAGVHGYEIYQLAHSPRCCGGLKQIGLALHNYNLTQNTVMTAEAPSEDQPNQ